MPGYDIAGEAPSHSLGWRLLSCIIDDIISAQTTSFFGFFSWFSHRIEFCKHYNSLSLYVIYMLLYIVGKLRSSSFKRDSYHSSIPTHTKSISILVKLTSIQISWPFLIGPSLLKWRVLAMGPILPDCMVQQTFRRYSVQITALLVP